MDIEKVQKLLKGKTKIISIKINPDLVALLDKTINEDKALVSRNEFFERCILKYLSDKGKI